MIRVLIVDDDRLTRSGLIASLPWGQFGMEVVGEARNGERALDFLASHAVDLVLADLAMPTMSGIDFMRIARRRHPDALFVVLTFHQELEYLQDAIRLGAIDFIVKEQLERERYDHILGRIRDRFLLERARRSAPGPAGADRLFHMDTAYVFVSTSQDDRPDRSAEAGRLAASLDEIDDGTWLWIPRKDAGRKDRELLGALDGGFAVLRVDGLTGENVDNVESVLRRYRRFDFFFDFDPQRCILTRTLRDLNESEAGSNTEALSAMEERWLALDWITDDGLFSQLARELRAARPQVSDVFGLLAVIAKEWNRAYGQVASRKLGPPPHAFSFFAQVVD